MSWSKIIYRWTEIYRSLKKSYNDEKVHFVGIYNEYMISKSKELKDQLTKIQKHCTELETELDQITRYILGYYNAEYKKLQKSQLELLEDLRDCVTIIQISEKKIRIMKIAVQIEKLRKNMIKTAESLEESKNTLLKRNGKADVSQFDTRLEKINACLLSTPRNIDHIYSSLLTDQTLLIEELNKVYAGNEPRLDGAELLIKIKNILKFNNYFMTLKRQEYSGEIWTLMQNRKKRDISTLELNQSEENIKRLKECIELYPPLHSDPTYHQIIKATSEFNNT